MTKKIEETDKMIGALAILSESGIATKCPEGYIYAILCDIAQSLARITDVLEKGAE